MSKTGNENKEMQSHVVLCYPAVNNLNHPHWMVVQNGDNWTASQSGDKLKMRDTRRTATEDLDLHRTTGEWALG